MGGVLEIRILGPLELWLAGERLDLGGGRQRTLLAALALRSNEVVSSDHLIDVLWGEQAPPTAAKAVQNAVSQLRKTLAGQEGVLVTRSPGYVLAVSDDVIDARRFERLAEEGRQALIADPDRAAECLRQGLELWRGPPLAEFAYDPFAQQAIGRLEELRIGAIEDSIDADLALGKADALVSELQAHVAAHPLRERLRAQLMLALYRSGRQAEALDAYRDGRQALRDELGLDPGPALRDLEQRILNQDVSLGPQDRHRGTIRRRRLRTRWLLLVGVVVLASLVGIAGALALRGTAPLEGVADSVVRIDPDSNRIVGIVRTGRSPGVISVVGPYVFVTNERDRSLSRLDTRTGALVTSGAHATGRGLAAQGDRFLWVSSESRREVVRVSVESLLAIDRIPLAADLASVFLAVGGGALWVSEAYPGAISQWDLRTHRLLRRYELGPYAFPVEVTFAAGAAWVGLGDSSELLRIEPRTGRTRRISVVDSPSDPTYGFGSMWVGTADFSSRTVWRVDATAERVRATVATGRVGWGLAAGAGSVWVSNYCDGTVSRIDPVTNAVIATIETGFFPRWLEFGAGGLWVSLAGENVDSIPCE